MKVEVEREARGFGYRLRPVGDDRTESRRAFSDSPELIRLVHDEYHVVLPAEFRTIHPDLHGLAIYRAICPFVGRSLDLPFAVSEPFARFMKAEHGVEYVQVDPALSPRQPPDPGRPGLLLSGGMDSVAASIIMPRHTEHLFLDRIPHFPPAIEGSDVLIDLVQQRALFELFSEDGIEPKVVAGDQEFLYRPYPYWHSDQSILAACYMADSLNLSSINIGSVLDAFYYKGYMGAAEKPESWRFDTQARVSGQELYRIVGLERAAPVLGCTEVGTVIIVNSTRYRGKTTSCYYRSPGPFCMRCDKCFKKLLLMYVVEDRTVPEELFEQFICQPRLAKIFEKPYFDWHQVWYYLFQRIRCRHWFARELHQQAVQGPDLFILAKWYPGDRGWIPEAYREEVEENIAKYLETMRVHFSRNELIA